MEWYLKVIQNYVGFTGRARRTEYWMFVLFNFIISIVLSLLEYFAGLGRVLTTLYGLALFLPGLAVSVRRLHDTGRSGLWVLISFIPIIGAIILIIFMCMEGERGYNKYGPDPKLAP